MLNYKPYYRHQLPLWDPIAPPLKLQDHTVSGLAHPVPKISNSGTSFNNKERSNKTNKRNKSQPNASSTNNVLDIVQQLAKAMRETNTTDTTEPTKFSGEITIGTN